MYSKKYKRKLLFHSLRARDCRLRFFRLDSQLLRPAHGALEHISGILFTAAALRKLSGLFILPSDHWLLHSMAIDSPCQVYNQQYYTWCSINQLKLILGRNFIHLAFSQVGANSDSRALVFPLYPIVREFHYGSRGSLRHAAEDWLWCWSDAL